MTRYIDTDRDVDVPLAQPSERTCLLCGFEATSATIWLKPAWWREPLDGKEVTTIPRCLDIDACRRRVADAGERWLLLETGEEPGRHPRREISAQPLPPGTALHHVAGSDRFKTSGPEDPDPVQADPPTPPDAEPTEEARHVVDYF